jgi:hypothetical protein
MMALATLACALCASVARAQPPAGPKWYRGNTHTHSINSDGDSAPDTVARWYVEHGYQFLVMTDHEYITDVAPLNALFGAKEQFLVLSGQEVTQWSAKPEAGAAHVNALFTNSVIYPVGERGRAAASIPLGETFTTNVAAIRKQGGIAQINHPNYMWSVKPEDLSGVPDGVLLEIWNGQGRINNLGGAVATGDVRPSAEGYWDWLLSRGKIVWGVATDDSHSFKEPGVNDPNGAAPGQAWIVVRAPELTPAAIKSAIQKGELYASTGVALTDITVTETGIDLKIAEARGGAGPRYVTRFIGQDGKVLSEVAGNTPSHKFVGGETYVRASIKDSNGKQAWTQPVFRDSRQQRASSQSAARLP